MGQKKKEAAAVTSLWKEQYDRTVREETESNGLVILVAFYGKSTLVTSMAELLHSNLLEESELRHKLEDPSSQVIDVRISIQCHVKESKLCLPGVSKVKSWV